MRKVYLYILTVILVVVIIPSVIYILFVDRESVRVGACEISEGVKVYDARIESVDEEKLENYVIGVVAAEMPANFPLEALKAQAVASRTYAIREQNANKDVDLTKIGQAYITTDEMKNRWQDNFDANYKKVSEAVNATRGQVLTYNSEPILAAFYSTSAGKTEVAQNVWGSELPYLKSVKSDGDLKAPNYESEVVFSKEEFFGKLKNYCALDEKSVYVTEHDESGYVSKVFVGGNYILGTEFRKLFGLRSACFKIVYEESNVKIITKGYGHGVGMSQYGAKFMAEDGKSYREILLHYYVDVIIKKL